MPDAAPIAEEKNKTIKKVAWFPVALTVEFDVLTAPQHYVGEGILIPVALLAVILDLANRHKDPHRRNIVKGLWLGFGLSFVAKSLSVWPGVIAELLLK